MEFYCVWFKVLPAASCFSRDWAQMLRCAQLGNRGGSGPWRTRSRCVLQCRLHALSLVQSALKQTHFFPHRPIWTQVPVADWRYRGDALNAMLCFSLVSFPYRDPEGRVYFAHPPQRPVKTFKTADNTLTCRELLLLIRHSKWVLPGPNPAMNGRSHIYCVACPLCCIKSDQLWVSLMVAPH